MGKGERKDLQRLIRQREKVLKSAAKQRSEELLADFENQIRQQYRFDQDEVWERAIRAAEREVQKAQKQVAARCRELGVPDRFAPKLDVHWYSRGEGAAKQRRAELRKMTETRIEAIVRQAITQIETSCLQAQEKIAVAGLTSDAARAFLEQLSAIETLMSQLSFAEVSGEADPPVAEQLLSSNALRQRRTPASGGQFPGVIEAPRGRHSEKPDIFAEHIAAFQKSTVRARRPGWNVWGNEATGEAASKLWKLENSSVRRADRKAPEQMI
jgi:hypothetical protein